MILTQDDLIRYLEADKTANSFKSKRPRILGDEIWRFLISLRKYEYYTNVTCWGGVFMNILASNLSFLESIIRIFNSHKCCWRRLKTIS